MDDDDWLTCSDLSDDASNNESGDSGESVAKMKIMRMTTLRWTIPTTTCTIRGLHLMNLLTWMTDDAEVTTVVQLSERIDGSSIPSAALRADIMHLCEVIPWLACWKELGCGCRVDNERCGRTMEETTRKANE